MKDTEIDYFDELEADAQRQRLPADGEVHTLEQLAKIYEDYEAEIAKQELRLAGLIREFQLLRQDVIPERMIEMGVKKLTLSDGSKLSYKPHYSGKILADEGYDYLEQAGYPDAVKQELKLEVSRVDKYVIEAVKAFVSSFENLSIKEKVSIHHMTLGKLVNTLAKQGVELPKHLFDVYIGNMATLKKGKSHGE